jgi:hypothetical protein
MTISYSDFKQLPREQQKETIELLRNEIGISTLIKTWGISRSKIYNIIHELDLSVSPKRKDSKINIKDSPKNTKSKKQSKLNNNLNDIKLSNVDIPLEQSPYFSVSMSAQGPFQTVSEKLLYLFQHNVPDTNVRITINIDEV